MEAFLPARRLYEKAGFQYCNPFAHYKEDPNSLFMTLNIDWNPFSDEKGFFIGKVSS